MPNETKTNSIDKEKQVVQLLYRKYLFALLTLSIFCTFAAIIARTLYKKILQTWN
jgi:hypothetical protein